MHVFNPIQTKNIHLKLNNQKRFKIFDDNTAEQIEIIDVENDESLHDETVEDEDDNSNKTFTNPSQIDKTTCSVLLKCEKCDFSAPTSLTIRNHKESTHNWCTNCYSTFNSQKQLKNHFKKVHSVKK